MKKVKNYTVELLPSKELSFVIGAFLGDGWKRKVKNLRSGNDYRISLASIDKEFTKKFSKCVASVLNKKEASIYVRKRKGKRPLYEVTYSSKLLYDFLDRPFKDIISVAIVYPSHFLRGLFDAEGYVARGKYWRVGLSNSNLKLLKTVKSILEKFGIKSRIEIDTQNKGIKKFGNW